MKAKYLFLFTVVLLVISLLVSCRQVKNTANKGKGIDKADTAIIKSSVSDQDEKINSEIIYFKASGNEPFWGLEITEGNFKFTSLSEGFETFNAPHTEPIRAMDANVKMYRIVTESGEMKIQIAQMLCTDDMSGKENKYQVTVELKRSIDKDFKTLKGCGNYITDYRLHDIWMLEELNGQPIDVQQYGKDRPRIEINSAKNIFMGFTGSHDINGKIFFEKGLLRFTDIVASKNVSAVEKRFIKNLQDATSYKLENNRLLLSNQSGQLLKFRKTD